MCLEKNTLTPVQFKSAKALNDTTTKVVIRDPKYELGSYFLGDHGAAN